LRVFKHVLAREAENTIIHDTNKIRTHQASARMLDENIGAGSSRSRCHWELEPKNVLRGRVSLAVNRVGEPDRAS
jgi:hypothetical protein